MSAEVSAAPARPRKPRVQTLMEVVRTEKLTPHMVRVVFGGAGFEQLEFKDATDHYIKLLFADPQLQLQRPYDLDVLREQLPQEQMPVTRTYTIRHIDWENQQLWVDFVIHGDEGLAGPWAAQAKPGDLMSFFGPGCGYAPRPEAQWHLLAGDEAALPAVAAALEAMPETAQGVALLEVRDAAEQLPISAPVGIDVIWLYRGADFSPESTLLASAIAQLEIPAGDVQVFIHGEREQMKQVRRILVQERGLERRGMSLSAYWAHGRVEDQFQAEKRTPIGQIDAE